MKNTTCRKLSIFCFALLLESSISGQVWKSLESTPKELIILVNYPGPESAYELEQLTLTLGLPSVSLPSVSITQIETASWKSSSHHPYNFDPPDEAVVWERLDRYRDLNVGILKISPLIREGNNLMLITKLQLTVSFPTSKILPKKVGRFEESLYESRIVNWNVAKQWVSHTRKVKKKRTLVLPEGDWYRISVESDGVYQITGSGLQAAGLNIQDIDPGSLTMFTNSSGGRPMPKTVGTEIPVNLVKVAIKIKGEGDGSFDVEDAIIFYGRGPRGFDSSGPLEVTFTQNPYTDTNIYWLHVPDDPGVFGKRVSTEDTTYTNPVLLNYGISYFHLEDDLDNPFDSGLLWVGAGFSRNQTGSLVFNLAHPKTDIRASLSLSVFGGTSSDSEEHPDHRLNVYQRSLNDSLLTSSAWSGLRTKTLTADLHESRLENGPNFIIIQNVSTDNASKIHFDWGTIRYGHELKWEDIPVEFFAPPNVEIASFALSNINSDVITWDITDFTNPREQKMTLIGSTGYFEKSLPDSQPARFIAFVEQDVPEITTIVFEENQTFSNLRTERFPVDHIIIAPDDFLIPAERLKQHRENSVVAPLQTVYDEFSGGVQDPLSIRYFLKWTKENWRNPKNDSFPSFLLLFGDGDYDYRNITGSSHNLVPTFQSSFLKGASSDDLFAYLDGNSPEMAIGRFPAVAITDVNNMVDKTIAYESDPEIGLWRRRITLIADDFARPNFGPIELTHTKNSESIAEMIPSSLEVQKIYMEDYPAINDGSQFGITKPDATEALFDILEQGTVILNYIGHGSAYQWAQEGLLTAARGDLSSIHTGMKLPIWMAATCSWGRYDNVEGNAMSEEILRLSDNGAVAIISTTGLITFSANREFVLKLFGSFFAEGNITDKRLGAVYSSIKDGSSGSDLFHLFGDPALKLALTPNRITVEHVSPDTLVALKTGKYSGFVEAADPPEGEGYVVLYDTDRIVTKSYEQNLYSEVISYTLLGRTLFRGLVPFNSHTFQGSFIVPKDISYATANSRLSVYLYNKMDGYLWEGLGVKEGLILAGGTGNPLDSDGPLISFGLEDRKVEWGDHVPENGELVIKISDPLGINVTGEIGHAIRLWMNEDESNHTDLTARFIYDPESYTSGSVSYSLTELLPGESLLTVEAWDNANNPAQKSISLNVTSFTELTLTNVFNYPNPFKNGTQFAFEVTQEANVTIKIFTITGQLIRKLDPMETFMGYSHIDWDGRDDFGDEIAYGAYLYQVTAIPIQGGQKATRIKKIAKSP